MDSSSTQARRYKIMTIGGWVVSIAGMALWLYGYNVEGGAPYIDWPGYVPDWAADFVPNWEAELGLLLSTLAMAPIYYVQYKEIRVEKDSGD